MNTQTKQAKKQINESNDKKLKRFFDSLDLIDQALLRERLNKIADITEQSIKENVDAYRSPFTNEHDYLRLTKLIREHLGFEDINGVIS